ncbi:unnamed protein product [Rotaria magnacalcarata]|uniref:Uncharacterized protein n=2 Tax=Rotaria magnacalcarata TaxID=392030 RepID=A0A817A1J6_9BILA|nr:unnamed protein product [Rotaria magnacalcarata]CAF3993878.1 unnamed protein product [Rotaria magnacalcarata]
MSSAVSSSINAALRTRRSNKQHRRRNELPYVISHPTSANILSYLKYFFFKSTFGRLALLFLFLAVFHAYILCYILWPKLIRWLHSSTSVQEL